MPPAPPPIERAAASRRAGAVIPRPTAAAVAPATSIAFPSAPLPTTTTAGPALSRSRTFWARSRRPPGSSPGISATTRATPSTSCAPATSDAISASRSPARNDPSWLRSRLFSSRTLRARSIAPCGSFASSASTSPRRSARSASISRSASGPTSASTRRIPAPIEPSRRSRITATLPVRCTCVPPQSSRE